MRDDLVALQVPVDPRLGAAALFEPEHLAVELAGGGQVVDGHGEVKAGDGGLEKAHVSISSPPRQAGFDVSRVAPPTAQTRAFCRLWTGWMLPFRDIGGLDARCTG